jgi:hypothetical protein
MTLTRRELGKIATKCALDELESRSYSVNSSGNTLSVCSPNGINFIVKVTSLSSANVWLVPEAPNDICYFMLVFKPITSMPEFFILTKQQMDYEKATHQRKKRLPIDDYSNPELERKDIGFKQPIPYKDNWSSLPA